MKGFFSFRAQVVKLMKITQIKCFENLGIAISHSSNLFVYISDNHGKYPLTVIGYAGTDLYGDTSLGTHFGTIRGHFDRLLKLQFQNSFKYQCFEERKALFLINCTQYRRLLQKQRYYCIVSLLINIPSKISYRIINDKYLLKNIISYHWWYFHLQIYHIVSLMII